MAAKAKKPAERASATVTTLHAAAAPAARAARESVAAATDSMRDSAQAGLGYATDLAALSRENLAAVLEANAALAQGFEAIAGAAAGYARHGFNAAGEAAKELLAARTLDQMLAINAGFATSGLETLFAGVARLSELGFAAANSVWAPLGGRVEAYLARLSRPGDTLTAAPRWRDDAWRAGDPGFPAGRFPLARR